MIERIIDFLDQNGGKATSADIVKNVFKMPEVNSGICDMLVQSTVSTSNRIVKSKDHTWCLVNPIENSNLDTDFILIKAVPERSLSFWDWARLDIRSFPRGEKSILLTEKQLKEYSDDELKRICKEIKAKADGQIVVFDGFGNQVSLFRRMFLQVTGHEFSSQIIFLKRLLQRLQPENKISESSQISSALGVTHLENAAPDQQFELFLEQFTATFELCETLGLKDAVQIADYCESTAEAIDFSQYQFDREYLNGLPELPGIYLMRDVNDRVMYVGKSRNLYERVNSYFRETENLEAKISSIRDRIRSVEIRLAGSELEALLLEYEAIQNYDPDINKQIDVHKRSIPSARLKPCILFLEHFDASMIKLYCVKPNHGLLELEVQKQYKELSEIVNRVLEFFSAPTVNKTNKRIDIVASWLYTSKMVNLLNMDTVQNCDLERLIADHIASFIKGENDIIHI